MAKKEIKSIDKSLDKFKELMSRASLEDFVYLNNVLCSKPKSSDRLTLVLPDQPLWLELSNDKDLKDRMKEVELNNTDHEDYIEAFSYLENANGTWLDLDSDELYKGSIIYVNIHPRNYSIPINKKLLPVKLKKSEFNNIKYMVSTSPLLSILIKKRFDYDVDSVNYGFSMMHIYKIT